MATQNFVLYKGYDAAAAITKFRAVKFSAEETVTPVTAIGDLVAGIAMFGVTAPEIAKGKGASIAVMGAMEMEASEAIAVGVEVGITADGRAVSFATAAAGTRLIGYCREGSAAVGERISVQLNLPGRIK